MPISRRSFVGKALVGAASVTFPLARSMARTLPITTSWALRISHVPRVQPDFMDGLDASNSNAAARAIVVHGAWYVSDDIAKNRGTLGRSEGCFAMSPSSITEVLATLGSGRLIYAGKA